ncbi:MAG: type II pantothenate kinase [Ruminococcaceae bacterium]|nr:type II pantothenate kinase [Oscillospiraceae bacterium]
MMVTVGIDIGGSTTKIVGFSEGKLVTPISVKAADPLTSIYGALGRFTYENGFTLEDIDKLMVTGVGASFIKDSLYSRPCYHVSEFESVAKGGIYLSGLERAVVASMGTGTALVYAEKSGKSEYLGGTGVGGGTLAGLSKIILGMDDIDHITKLASDGNLKNIDLQIVDMSSKTASFDLPGDMTAANFGKVSDMASRPDIALGIINMIFETVGMMAIFAARRHGIKDIVLTGHLTTVPQAAPTFKVLSDMFGINFIIPELSQFATVIGAALQNTNN